jgi:katanin p60 ATPase-containing subunit A1
MMTSTMNKYEYEAKVAREKRENERRKNILILILRHLINMGYSESAFKLQEEANLNLDKYDVADNIDLYIIICEYEEFFELKYNKKPKLVNLIESHGTKLPFIKKESRNSQNPEKKTPRQKTSGMNTNRKQENSNMNSNVQINKEEFNFELVGEAVNLNKNQKDEQSQKFSFNDQKESILLKPFPDNLFGNTEMKELAGMVKR